MKNQRLIGNEIIEEAIAALADGWTAEGLNALVDAICERMNADGHLLIPVNYNDSENTESYVLRALHGEDGEVYMACFTSEEELQKAPETSVISFFMDVFFEAVIDQESARGLVINPFGVSLHIPKNLLQIVLAGKKPQEDDYLRQNKLLEKAICFATTHHAGQLRKGTHIPYILHPLETMDILRQMGADNSLLMAGVLHDTVEDTDATADDITERFGTEVASLVSAHSEDKSKTWEERKTHAIQELEQASVRLKALVMADKLSNMRSIAADYAALGDKLWERFNAPMEKQAWYYSGIIDALCEMQNIPPCAHFYWELNALFKDVFVKFYRSTTEEEYLLQVSAHGTGHRLDKGNPDWYLVENYEELIEKECEIIPRLDAEAMEDEWNGAAPVPQ